MKKATTAAIVSALLWGVTGTSCASTKASGEDVQPVGDNATTITTDSGVTLPAGVLPPNNPPEPGDAPLGPDGHYNYDAPEFVLTNPCDDPEIMGRLDRLGFREQSEVSQRVKGTRQLGCIIGSESSALSEVFGIWRASIAHPNLASYGGLPIDRQNGVHDGVTYTMTTPIGLSYCIASVETERGSLGFAVDITGQDDSDLTEELCKPVDNLLTKYLGDL